jgi:hypothetical protein
VLAALAWPLEIAFRRLRVPPTAFAPARRAFRRVALRRPHPGAQRVDGEPGAAPPPASTTARLLERKRTFRERRDRSG